MATNPDAPKLSSSEPGDGWLRSRWRRSRDLGFANTLSILIQRVFPEWMLSAQACYMTNRDLAPYAKADVENLGVRLFRPEDHPRIAHFDTAWETLKQMPKEDWDGFVLEVNGELVAAAWFHRHHFSPEPWLKFTVPERVIALYHHVVDPPHRRKSYPDKMRIFALRKYYEEGFTDQLSSIQTTNIPSLKEWAKAGGSKIVGRLWYVKLFGLRLVGHEGKLRLGRWSPERNLVIPLSLPDTHKNPD